MFVYTCHLDRLHIKIPFNENPVCVGQVSISMTSPFLPPSLPPTKAWVLAEYQVFRVVMGREKFRKSRPGDWWEQKWGGKTPWSQRDGGRLCAICMLEPYKNILKSQVVLCILWVNFCVNPHGRGRVSHLVCMRLQRGISWDGQIWRGWG